MNVELKTQGGADTADKARLVAAVVLVLAGLAAYYVLDTQPAWVRWGAVVGGVVLAAAVLFASQYGRDLRQFVLDARTELRKVVWPSGADTRRMGFYVFLFVVIAGVFFWVVDLVLAWATRHLTGAGS